MTNRPARTVIGPILTTVLLSITCVQPVVARPQDNSVRFTNVAREAGIIFEHENGATPEKYMPETMGSGGLFFDYDSDGWLDIFLVNGGSFVDERIASGAGHQLYRNNGNGTFSDASEGSGIGKSGYGMGACSADYDNDGWADLYITNVASNHLYRNNGTGGFTEVTDRAGVGTNLWSSSCAFGDVDNDGDVDLYVVNYVDFTVENNKVCGRPPELRAYCHPNVYNGLSDILYRNNGDGSFTDVSRESGVYSTAGKGLGVVFADYDNDGWLDIYVANDSVANFLFHNLGDGTFEESALWNGVAVDSKGKPLAGMGTDMADFDGDGFPDAFVTNLNRQTHNLYRNLGDGAFADVTTPSGVGEATFPFVGFGTAFLDYDNDTDLDLAVANGHIIDNVSGLGEGTYPQRNLILQNDGRGEFKDVGPESGSGFALEKVSRALAVGDYDNDGDLDILITNTGQTSDLLRNDGPVRGNSLLVRTQGSRSNRDGIGARLSLSFDDNVVVRQVKAGSGYLSQNDLRVHFGMGSAPTADRLEIIWPSGVIDVLFNVDANQILTVTEDEGITSVEPLVRVGP